MFSIRIVTTDHYQAAPLQGLDVCHSDFGHCHVAKVPVIRVFGATPAGMVTLGCCVQQRIAVKYNSTWQRIKDVFFLMYAEPPEAENAERIK